MMQPIFQINAFASGPFSGNPATVCPLSEWPDDALLQRIAAESQLTCTFFVGGAGCQSHEAVVVEMTGVLRVLQNLLHRRQISHLMKQLVESYDLLVEGTRALSSAGDSSQKYRVMILRSSARPLARRRLMVFSDTCAFCAISATVCRDR